MDNTLCSVTSSARPNTDPAFFDAQLPDVPLLATVKNSPPASELGADVKMPPSARSTAYSDSSCSFDQWLASCLGFTMMWFFWIHSVKSLTCVSPPRFKTAVSSQNSCMWLSSQLHFKFSSVESEENGHGALRNS